MLSGLRLTLSRWLTRSHGVESGAVVLTQRRIFILPSRSGLLFGSTVLLMLFGCVNYNLSLGYLLTFLLAGSGMVSILHTFRNLAQLRIAALRATPVFAGDEATFPISLNNPTPLPRASVSVQCPAAGTAHVDIAPASGTVAYLRVHTQRRGRLPLPRLRIFTTFPLGLFYAWSNVALDTQCVVYPKPEAGHVPLPPPELGARSGSQSGAGQDDFAGLRKYAPGDSLRHVAWKAVARGQPVLTKQFIGLAEGELWLDWSALPSDFGVEAKLSRLTRWVVDATAAGQTYGLRIPGVTIAPASGSAHEEQCLTALALYGHGQ